ncbi:septum formation initiator family protein [Cryobacterium frigoriphilum]|uniref:Septum formation initiator family protein n=1 Tax=Cryobacterium frigoriphilum TaxID=1259150 RepID=A0A4R9A722_9MICO|nr:septum formation initiator family protein [Cryobacterium frigoriphilum]TFD53439.1 septum formation initiator family protein [Cryobacterium frigoriphilum]
MSRTPPSRPRTGTPAPVDPETVETPVAGWLRGIRFSGFSLMMMAILVMAVVVLAPSLRTYAEQRQEINRLSASVDDQRTEVDDLEIERDRWDDRTFVTTQARERLSYVLPGDISFLVINDLPVAAAGTTDAPPVSSKIQDTDIDWLDSMFASVMTAGLAPEAAAPASGAAVTPAVPGTTVPEVTP